MKNVLKYYLVAFMLLSDFVTFAQPGDEDGGGGLEGNDPQPAPINGKLILLAIIGVLFVIYTFRKNKKTV
jgi:hypothetical protein